MKKPTSAVIIPARYASTRFPGKPLVDIDGKSMLQRVHEQASQSQLCDRVIVATDDDRIYEHVKAFGGEVEMTSTDHTSGTDRCAEVVSKMDTPPDLVVNVQGDEPFIDPRQIDDLIQVFHMPDCQIATLIAPITSEEELKDPNRVRVVRDTHGRAMYFSRAVIPHWRGATHENWHEEHPYYKHVGIYAYRTETLSELTQLEPSLLEQIEGLEQLRWLENGYHIHTTLTLKESPCIDTPEDLKFLEQWLKINK